MKALPMYGVEKHSKAAVRSAYEAIVDRARKMPEQFVNGMLNHPAEAGKIRNFDEVVEILLEKGQQAKLDQLVLSPKLPGEAKKILMNKLYF